MGRSNKYDNGDMVTFRYPNKLRGRPTYFQQNEYGQWFYVGRPKDEIGVIVAYQKGSNYRVLTKKGIIKIPTRCIKNKVENTNDDCEE